MSINDAFNSSVDYYDAWVEKALPCCDDLFSVAIESIPFFETDKLNVLDLGAGTGLFSHHVFRHFAQANFTLVDIAEKMLNIARKRFIENKKRFTYIVNDYRKSLPDQKFDLIISSLSIHHLDAREKQRLFKNIHSKLKKTGVFVNIDQIKAPSKHFENLYWSTWLDKVREAGATEKQIELSIARRQEFDKDSTMTQQLDWLRSAGFAEADCLYHHYFVGVFFAQK